MKRWITGISRNVFVLGLVSFFNDISSEMIFPILPIFLTSTLGVSVVVVGLIEGLAEVVASIFKIIAGMLSDVTRRRKPFVVLGYSSSTIGKSLFGLARGWGLVLFARVLDRFGKGMRTSTRDALVSASSDHDVRGRSFGYQRGMDSFGAVFGPLITLALLHWLNLSLRTIFFLAVIPSIIGVILLILFVREMRPRASADMHSHHVRIRMLGRPFVFFLGINAIFALGNSSEVFLILRTKDLGMSLQLTILAFVLLRFTAGLFSTWAGGLADRLGARKVIQAGFFLFAFVYAAMGFMHTPMLAWIIFPLYGLYDALTIGTIRAYISEIVPQAILGTAYGLFDIVIGIGMFLASLIAGLLWTYVHSATPFLFGSALALCAAVLFTVFERVEH